MAKSLGLRKFFAQAKKRVPIKVGNRLMEFTATQAVRLSDLADTRKDSSLQGDSTTGAVEVLSLEEAAFNLLVSEDALLNAAAEGHHQLYIDISGLRGRWMSKSDRAGVRQSAVHTARHGYLALVKRDAATLAASGFCAVTMLTISPTVDAAALNLPGSVRRALDGWGSARKHFRLETPLQVTRESVRLLPPLAANDG